MTPRQFETQRKARIEDLKQVYEELDSFDRPRLKTEKCVWHREMLAIREAISFLKKVKT